jgi:hypothetical protein
MDGSPVTVAMQSQGYVVLFLGNPGTQWLGREEGLELIYVFYY